jgi:hypothetical protein
MDMKIQAARNFAAEISAGVTGKVIKSSIVPVLFSSEKSLIVTDGARKRKIQGCQVKKSESSAWPDS